jgi:type IV secretion system protein VirB10
MNQRKIQELEQDLSADQRQGQQAQRAGNNSTASTVNGPTAPAGGVASPATQLPPTTEPPRDPVANAEKAIAFKARFASEKLLYVGHTRTAR